MPDSTYLELNDDVGVTAGGNLEPLVSIGVAITVPTMVKDPETGKNEMAELVDSVTIESATGLAGRPARFLPGTRIVEVADPRVHNALLQTAHFHEIDAPTKKDAEQQKKALTDAVEEAGTHAQDPDNPQEG